MSAGLVKCVTESDAKSSRDVERFWSKVDKSRTDGCWYWTGSRSSGKWDYGIFTLDGHRRRAHRIAYELAVGPIPEGLEMDHLCRVPRCVNPSHLEPVTHQVNIKRGSQGSQTACVNGHPYTEENTIYRRAGNRRKCRICDREAQERFFAKHGGVAAYYRALRRRSPYYPEKRRQYYLASKKGLTTDEA